MPVDVKSFQAFHFQHLFSQTRSRHGDLRHQQTQDSPQLVFQKRFEDRQPRTPGSNVSVVSGTSRSLYRENQPPSRSKTMSESMKGKFRDEHTLIRIWEGLEMVATSCAQAPSMTCSAFFSCKLCSPSSMACASTESSDGTV